MLVIYDKIIIPAPAEKVWQELLKTDDMSEWNNHIVKWEGLNGPELKVGYNFRVAYKLGSNFVAMEGEITRFEPGHCLQWRLDNPVGEGKISAEMVATETFTIAPTGGGVKLSQFIEVENSGMPRWAEWLIGLIQRIGKPVDKNAGLAKLGRMVLDKS